MNEYLRPQPDYRYKAEDKKLIQNAQDRMGILSSAISNNEKSLGLWVTDIKDAELPALKALLHSKNDLLSDEQKTQLESLIKLGENLLKQVYKTK
jgi:hypothetical protein